MEQNELNMLPFTIRCTICGNLYVIQSTYASADSFLDVFFLLPPFLGFNNSSFIKSGPLCVRSAASLPLYLVKCKTPEIEIRESVVRFLF